MAGGLPECVYLHDLPVGCHNHQSGFRRLSGWDVLVENAIGSSPLLNGIFSLPKKLTEKLWALLFSMLLIWLIIMGLIFKSWVAWLALVILYLFSTQPVASLLIRSLERHPVFNPEQALAIEPQAIVILGGGLPRISPEMSGFRPSMYTLERLRYGAWLSRQTDLPVLVSGGGYRPEAAIMAESLRHDFGVETRWLEDQSTTTWENAVYARATLPEDIQSVLLVTHGWHMSRAALSFARVGFHVIPAPGMLADAAKDTFRISQWLPSARYLIDSERALREYVGYFWYWLVYRG